MLVSFGFCVFRILAKDVQRIPAFMSTWKHRSELKGGVISVYRYPPSRRTIEGWKITLNNNQVNMGPSYPRLIFFGNEVPSDGAKDLFRRLCQHSKDRRFRLLSIFLDESAAILKEEAAKLPKQLQELIPHFETVCSLADVDFRQGPLGAAMESALLTILELALFIGCVPVTPLTFCETD